MNTSVSLKFLSEELTRLTQRKRFASLRNFLAYMPPSRVIMESENDGHITFVSMRWSNYKITAFAVCSPDDTFNPHTGVSIALARALDKLVIEITKPTITIGLPTVD